MPVLVVLDGPHAGRRFDFDGAETVVGREGPGITIDDRELSRRHAVVRVSGERVEIQDLGSLNGTYVNGERLKGARTLADGDTVRIGATTLSVETGAPSGATVLSAPAAPPAEPPAPPPSTPFGHSAAGHVARPRVASRMLTPQLFTTACIVGTAVSLALYFALR